MHRRRLWLACCYFKGDGIDKDYRKAVEWFLKATEQEFAPAQTLLGDRYYYGEGVDKDYGKAVKWYQKASEQGHTPGQYKLGNCYSRGTGVEQDDRKAAEWYRKAADQAMHQHKLVWVIVIVMGTA